MKILILTISSILLTLSFSACSGNQPEAPNTKLVTWIKDPRKHPEVGKEKTYGLGQAGEGVGSFSEQKDRALKNAISNVAMQVKVQVESTFTSESDVNGAVGATRSNIQRKVESALKNLTTRIVAEYYDKNKRIYYILVIKE
jgi:hypothetical protein